ncbi:MAG: V-type ATP synthase subunit D [Thermodesulfobacteriota bacterium]
MAGVVKYNKTALKSQRDALAKYQKFLPILVLKKMQLQIVLRQMEPKIEAKRLEAWEKAEGLRVWAVFLADPEVNVEDFVRIQAVLTQTDNVAGVAVPEFQEVAYEEKPYSLFATPAWLDPVIEGLRGLVNAREELRVLQEKEALLREELRITTQRVNLFEKRLIPELRENIRRIKIFLGDEETAAVGRAKLTKAKIAQKGASQS